MRSPLHLREYVLRVFWALFVVDNPFCSEGCRHLIKEPHRDTLKHEVLNATMFSWTDKTLELKRAMDMGRRLWSS